MYRPARKGEPANDALLQKAIDNYKLASEKITEETSPKRSLALEYLVAAYGPDKLERSDAGRTGRQRMIQLAPNEPTELFRARQDLRGLGRVPAGRADLPAGPRTPSRTTPRSICSVAGYYNRQGDFDKLMENIRNEHRARAEQNPEAHYRLATY